MKVVIVGGGIAGLSLANSLEKADIDFVLLERRSLFDPQVGASIGMGPNSLRILDQVGAAEEILNQTTPVNFSKHHQADGKLIMPVNHSFQVMEARFGYGISFMDRQLVLRALYNAVQSKEKCLLNKQLKEVEHLDDGVKVHCEDGTSYEGDMVIGCDGVNSKVRSEMWRIAAKTDPSYFSQKEREKMTAEYICLFGISSPVEGLHETEVDNTYDKNHSFLVITGKGGRVFWFYFEKLPKPVHYNTPEFPRYTPKDAEELAEKNGWRPCHEKLKFRDLWKNRITYTLVPMEEALFENWYWGRIATIGDNAHKMTANQGSAGNAAIESVAALANQLKKIQNDSSPSATTLPSADIQTAFAAWRAKRKARIEATCKEAAALCRMQGLAAFGDYITVFWVLPNAADFILSVYTKALIGAEVLEYLPLPGRSMKGSAPFNPKLGVGNEESTLLRVLKATPLLALSWFAFQSTPTSSIATSMIPILEPITASEPRWNSAMSFNLTTGLLFGLWFLESNRRANAMTPVQLAPLFASLAHCFNPSLVAPTFYFLHYIFTPMEKFAAADMRLTNTAYTRTVLPLMLGHDLYPIVTRFAGLDMALNGNSRWWTVALAPLLVSSLQWLFVKFGLSTTDIHQDVLHNQKKDLPYIRWTVYGLSGLSTLGWWYSLAMDASLLTESGSFLAKEHGAFLASTAVWLALLFHDLKTVGMEKFGWVKILLGGVVTAVLAGPTTALGLGWLWREESLAFKHHQNAHVSEKYGNGKTVWEIDGLEPPNVIANGHVNGTLESKLNEKIRETVDDKLAPNGNPMNQVPHVLI